MNKYQVVKKIFDSSNLDSYTVNHFGQAFAPSNIALIKYWGKSHIELNIPNTDSLSISLNGLGSDTSISIIDIKADNKDGNKADLVIVNNIIIENNSEFYIRIKNYLDLFRQYELNNKKKPFDFLYKIQISINIPVASGLASSACGFAALVLAFDKLFNLKLDKKKLSILARLGSGSACRSLWDGFVYWQKGIEPNGLDSYGYLLEYKLTGLCVGLLILSDAQKAIGSTKAMIDTCKTSVLYKHGWKEQVKQDMFLIKKALNLGDLSLLGETAENNALAMHATMLAAKPAILYANRDTIIAMQEVWSLRKKGVNIYFTQDAGPNLKLIFHVDDLAKIKKVFSEIQVVQVF